MVEEYNYCVVTPLVIRETLCAWAEGSMLEKPEGTTRLCCNDALKVQCILSPQLGAKFYSLSDLLFTVWLYQTACRVTTYLNFRTMCFILSNEHTTTKFIDLDVNR